MKRPRTWPAKMAASLLTVGVISWAAAPISQAGAGTRIALLTAIVTGVFSLAQLALASLRPRESGVESVLERQGKHLIAGIQAVPWPEVMIVAVLALEALHRSRPWHTAVLGVAMLGDLLAIHLAETRAGASVLRRQLPVLGAGVGLCALAVGAAALPGLTAGPLSMMIRVIAIVAAVVACGLVLPAWLGGDR